MASAEHSPESVLPQQRRASGAEVTPIVDGADGAAESAEDLAKKKKKRAEREVTEADERRIHRLRLHPAVATAEE